MEERDLVALFNSLSLDEKIGQLVQLSGDFFLESDGALAVGPDEQLGISPDLYKIAGSVLNVVGKDKMLQIQRENIVNSEHPIPLLFMADIIYGYRTVFPIPLALGCSWDLSLVQQAYQILANEARNDGVNVTFSPMVDLVRDARWGRCLESTGEDPLLNSKFAKAMVTGIQQEDENGNLKGIVSCVKHFAAYGAAESGKEYNTVDMSNRELRQNYLPAYKAAIDAGCRMVMSSFNSFNGIPATANKYLMKQILREEFEFNGVVISDFAAVQELVKHGVAEDERSASKLAIDATTDIDMKSPCYANSLKDLLNKAEIEEQQVDNAVWRVLKLKNELGLFETDYRQANNSSSDLNLPDSSRNIARKMATESVVLLKNSNNLLPLKSNKDKILLVGPYADSKDLIGLWAVHADKNDCITIHEGMSEYSDLNHLKSVTGCGFVDDIKKLRNFGNSDIANSFAVDEVDELDEVMKLASSSDVVIFAVGEHELQSGEAGSRTDIRIPEKQRRLMKKVAKLHKKMVLISLSGRPIALTKESQYIDAILQAWYPGIEGGHAIADIIFGKENPSGRLSVSMPRSVGQEPLYYNTMNTGRPDEGQKTRFLSRYTDCDRGALYPFGFGLSYSEVCYKDLKVEDTQNHEIHISVKIKNLSERAVNETVQLYLRDMVGQVTRPIKELRDFKKINLMAHESKQVNFEIVKDQLVYYDYNEKLVPMKGELQIMVGKNSEDYSTQTIYI